MNFQNSISNSQFTMRVRTNFPLPLLFTCFLSLIISSAQTPLDSHLQNGAFKTFFTPNSGVTYDIKVPSNLTGIEVSAMWLGSGNLRTRGVKSYKEFEIPKGVIEQPYVKRLILVYQNLGNWSKKLYPLTGYSYLAPVLGLLAYDGTNLVDSNLLELKLRASNKPILVKFPYVKNLAPYGSLAKCVYFDLDGHVKFDTLLNGNVCPLFQQGHVSIVVKSNVPPTQVHSDSGHGKNKFKFFLKQNKFKLMIVIISLFGGIVLLIMFGLMIARMKRAKQETKIKKLELEADCNETLKIVSIGDTKTPLALGTRTRPTIENNYVP